jgi:3alpha(or 20beta)-hydroxysteroid dehydrogenase
MRILEGKVAIVTGGGRGMGAATARLLASQGAKVTITDLDPSASGTPLSESEAEYLAHDVGDEAGWTRVVARTLERFGRIDALVNNAGIHAAGRLQETDPSVVERIFRINQLGTFLGMRAVIDPMSAVGGGSIINLASCVAMRGVTDQFAYAASKWAVRGMTKCAALELAPFNIRVNSINPGPTDTPLMADFSAEQRAALIKMMPLGRLGQAEDIASAIAFLVSDAASFISGAELDVDGAIFA